MHIIFSPENVLSTGTKDISITKYRLMTSLYRRRLQRLSVRMCFIFEIGRERLGGVSFHTFQPKTNQKHKVPRGHSFNKALPSSALRYFHDVYVDEKERCPQEPASF